jgi:hypothetical protein
MDLTLLGILIEESAVWIPETKTPPSASWAFSVVKTFRLKKPRASLF